MNGKIIKDALILFLITVIAGLGLGAVYGITKAPIEKANYNIQQECHTVRYSRMQMHSTIWTDLILKKQQKQLQQQDTQMTRLKTVLSL